MVYVTGDMHGDIARFDSPALKRLKKGDTLIVCGDFGFVWDNSKAEQKTLKKLGSKKYNICFIDGTHENFELLNAFPVTEWCGGKVHHICGNLYHLMRGQVFRIDNMTFFTMGGGESPTLISALRRTPGRGRNSPAARSCLRVRPISRSRIAGSIILSPTSRPSR